LRAGTRRIPHPADDGGHVIAFCAHELLRPHCSGDVTIEHPLRVPARATAAQAALINYPTLVIESHAHCHFEKEREYLARAIAA
jgi:hypothetical protein